MQTFEVIENFNEINSSAPIQSGDERIKSM